MPQKPLSDDLAQQAWNLVLECLDEGYVLDGNPSAREEAAIRAVKRGMVKSISAFRNRVAKAELRGLAAVPAKGPKQLQKTQRPFDAIVDDVRKQLRQPKTADELKRATGATGDELADAIEALRDRGVAVEVNHGQFEINVGVTPAYVDGEAIEIVSRPDNTFVFGAIGDKHIGSKYFRDDVLTDMYARFAKAGVDAVFDTGNWIDGDARFNVHDCVVRGLDPQVRLMADVHPRIPGVTTYAVWGDDHEGWLAQREGVDVGRYAEQIMRSAGHDWVDLGFMEAHIKLINANTGASAMMSVVHPGGGSSYAVSYSIQKIIESLDGGEKPAVGLYGHYHKMWAGNIRNVWCAQTGCAQDQTPFMRKKKLEAHVGGLVIRMEQDPATGAIVGFSPQMIRYFNRGYYQHRWSKHGPVTRAERVIQP